MNSLLSSVHDLPGADGEHAAELASCVCFPSIVERATKRKLAALRAESEYKWNGIVGHEVVEKGLRPTN
jgi:hypothetical protein